MKKKLTVLIFIAITSVAYAQIPAGYYDSAIGLEGFSLKTALHNIIDNHNSHSYDNLYNGYETTDTDNYYENDGTVLDMYSENPIGSDPYNYTHGSNQCGNYSNEGDCYNREHLFPQGFFNEALPMRSDIHFVVPSDGKVNGMRSNYPFGEVGSASWTSLNGSKKGTSISPGYSGTVFEPIDEFKGDIARCLLYFVTRYEGQLSGFEPSNSNNPLDGSENQAYENWYVELLLKWHNEDPVSQREIDRNNAAYNYQNNRNPFIDHPEWAECIWNNGCGVQNPDNFIGTATSESQIDLTWTLNDDNNDVVVAYNTTNTFGTPTGTYIAGQTISGGGEVLFVGNSTSFNHTGLSQQTYYYKIWSIDAADEYSSGIEMNASPLMPEPTNNVSNFIVSNETTGTISLTWTDATGGQLPDNYVVKASTSGITPPVDGIPEADTQFVKNISYGTEAVTFSGLTPSTMYFFEIYAYTNSGSYINYNTNDVESAIGNTLEGSSEIINEDFTNCIPTGWTTYSVTGNNDWTCDDVNHFIYVNAYGSDAVCNDWLISPANNLDIYEGETLNFQSWTRYNDAGISDPEVKLKYSTNYSGTGDPEIATWTELTYSYPAENSQVWTSSGDVDFSSINGTSVYFAFVYTSSGTGGGSSTLWQIDDVVLYGSLIATGDSNSEALPPTTQISGNTVSSLADTEPEAFEVFTFDIEDKGTSDGEITQVLNMRIYPGSSNTADWTNTIQNVKLNNGSDINITSLSITDGYINMLTEPVNIADGTSQTFTLSVWLNESNIEDGSILSFMIDADSHGFVANTDYSKFAAIFNSGSDIISSDFVIDVEATEIVFAQQTSNTERDVAMIPSPEVKATDVNGNTDINYTGSLVLVSEGNMQGDPITGIWNSGFANFGDIIHVEKVLNIRLIAVSSEFSNIMSNEFDVYCTPIDVSDLNAICGHENSEISWTNSSCYDEVILVVNDATISGTPTGTYVSNSTDYLDSLNPDFQGGGKVVYNGTASPQTITGLENGTNYYFKTFVNSYGMWSAGVETNCTPVTVKKINSTFRLYPNPVKDILTVENNTLSGINTIRLIDITGKVLMILESSDKYILIPLNFYSKGIYIIEISNDKDVFRDRIIIK